MSNKILAIGTLGVSASSPEIGAIMPREIPPTLKLYLDGHMDQFWVRDGNTGVVFLMNAQTVDEAKSLLEVLPLSVAKLVLVHGAWADGSSWNGVIEAVA